MNVTNFVSSTTSTSGAAAIGELDWAPAASSATSPTAELTTCTQQRISASQTSTMHNESTAATVTAAEATTVS